MRPIKFRAWHLGDDRNIHPPIMLYDENPGDCLVWKNEEQNIEHLMQFTGLHDKNGKEIWEGDILQFAFWSNTEPEKFYQIKWHFNRWVMVNEKGNIEEFKIGDKEFFEVIGNIYENPELLEKEVIWRK